MTYRDFCYWLQGFFELTGTTELNRAQIDIIKRHLDMVFIHERGDKKNEQLKPRLPVHEVRMKC